MTGPGAGATAGSVVALAATLIEAVAGSSGEGWSDAGGAVAQASALRRRASRLAAENAAAHRAALGALDASSTERPDREQEIADLQLGDALARAADLPLRIVEAAADTAELAAIAADRGTSAARPDAVGACVLAAAAAGVAGHLVEVNLSTRPGDERIVRARELVSLARATSERTLAAGAELG